MHTELSSYLISTKIPEVPLVKDYNDPIAVALIELDQMKRKETKQLDERVEKLLEGVRIKYKIDLKALRNRKSNEKAANLFMVIINVILEDYTYLSDNYLVDRLGKNRATIMFHIDRYKNLQRYADIQELIKEVRAMWKNTQL